MSRRKLRAALGTGAAGATASVLALAMALNVQAQPLLRLGSAPSQNLAAAESMGASDFATAEDKMAIWPMIEYRYLAGEGLSDQGGSGKVYQLQLSGDPKQRIEQLADLLGVKGQVVLDEWSTPDAPSYSVQGENFYLSIYWSGTGGWSYGSWTPYPEECYQVEPAAREESGSGESSDETVGETSLPAECNWQTEPTPELIPAEDQLASEAIKIMSATGLDVSPSDLAIYRDDWGASVRASLKVDGQETALEWYVGWGADGKLSYASGHSVEVLDRGSFNTISPKAAVDRLGDWRWYGAVASSVWEQFAPVLSKVMDARISSSEFAVAAEESEPSEGVNSSEEPSTSPSDETVTDEPTDLPADPAVEPTDDVVVEPLPVDPMPTEVEIIDLTIDSAQQALVTIYDANGGAWLVPGLLMFNSEGWFDSIIALEDGVIELPEPMDYEIMPLPAVKVD